jgi:DNA polymerase I-like protein with 3'-5' exonuclease and polymerase domains
MGIAVYVPEFAFYIPVGHSNFFEEAVNLQVPEDFFANIKCPVVYHNAKFDINVLNLHGLNMPNDKVVDTMLMCHYINENEFQFSLDAMTKKYCSVNKMTKTAKAMKGNDWDNMPIVAMGKYGRTSIVTLCCCLQRWNKREFQLT